jgi:hypothetical protein
MKSKTLIKLSLLTFIVGIFTLIIHPQTIKAIPATSVKDTLSSSQYSYYGGVGVGVSGGDTVLKIDTGTSFPSRTSNNLFAGDTLAIGVGGSQSLYTVKDVDTTATVVLNTGISAVSAVSGGSVIATRSAIHTISFTPQMNSTSGKWQVLIRASSTAPEKSSDGIPDQGGFDYGTLTAGAVSCPWGASASVGTTTSVTMGSPSTTAYYHVIQCALGAGITSAVGTGVTITIGTSSNALINPSSRGGSEGSANVFTFLLRQLDSNSNVLDQAAGQIAVVEAVRVTATVDPSLTFTIDAVGNTSTGSTACGTGTTLSVGATNTTADQVTFGSLNIAGNFNQLAQRLSCTTNAYGGYVVTAYEGGTMKNLNDSTTIPDTGCNGGGCTTTSATSWGTGSTTVSEFGYTITDMVGTSIFPPGNFKPFAIGSTGAQTIMSKSSIPSNTETANVCYRVTVSNTQEAGDYESKIIYTATATF